MELKTSTVENVQGNGTYKEMNKWDVVMENGDCGENLTKGDQEYFIKGKEVEYEYHPGKYPKIKRPYKRDSQPQQRTQSNDKVQLYIIRQSSLKAAIDFNNITMGDTKPTIDDICSDAEHFTKYVMNGLLLSPLGDTVDVDKPLPKETEEKPPPPDSQDLPF